MTQKQEAYKKSLIKNIQIIKSGVFVDDEQRREFMLSRFGVDSTTKLSIEELILLLKFCKKEIEDIPLQMASSKQRYRINELWFKKSREKTISSMINFVNKVAQRRIVFLDELRKDEATKVIVALERFKNINK